MYCINCGHKLDDGAYVCVKCGKIVDRSFEKRGNVVVKRKDDAVGISGMVCSILGLLWSLFFMDIDNLDVTGDNVYRLFYAFGYLLFPLLLVIAGLIMSVISRRKVSNVFNIVGICAALGAFGLLMITLLMIMCKGV